MEGNVSSPVHLSIGVRFWCTETGTPTLSTVVGTGKYDIVESRNRLVHCYDETSLRPRCQVLLWNTLGPLIQSSFLQNSKFPAKSW